MHTVAKVWYRLYYGLMLGFCVLVGAAAFVADSKPDMLGTYDTTFGISLTAGIIAGTLILYDLTFYFLIARHSRAMALLGSSMIFSLLLLYGLSVTDPSEGAWLYIGLWFMSVFLAGMYGWTYALGSLLIPCVYVLLRGNFDITNISTPAWILLGGSVVMIAASYFFWRHRFLQVEEAQLNRLSGMLRNNQEQSAILIQSIADAVIVTSNDGKISLMNPAAADMTEWPVNEATGIDVQLVVKLAQENGQEMKAAENPFTVVAGRKENTAQTLQLTGRNGKKRIISLLVSPVIVPGGELAGAVTVMRDVSEAHAAEQQRGEFISTASHEMRTPVAAIEGYLALALNDKVSTVDSRARSFLEKAHASTQHLGKLFQDLLTSAKAEDGRLSNHPSVVELGSFLEQLVEDFRFAAQKKGLLTDFVIGASDGAIDATSKGAGSIKMVKPLFYVQADPERLREVITNLFDNAIKYTDQGKISIGLTGDTELVQFYIHDTGAGIPPEDIPHLFQKFYRVDNSATRVIGGTGLGLFICRKIIELYDGRIWVESELGKGSTFFINLPRLTTQRATALQATETTAAAPTPNQQAKKA